MAFRTSESLTLIVQRIQAPTEGEWRAFLADFARQDLGKLRVLIMTEGGGPTAMQRATLKALMAGRSVRAAVVSDSIKVRSSLPRSRSSIRSTTVLRAASAQGPSIF